MNRGFSGFFGDNGASRARHAVLATSFLAGLLAVVIPAAGCSSSKVATQPPVPEAGPPACDSSKCSPGNQCIDDGSGSGPSCHEVCTGETCPYGWYCNDGVTAGQPANWCVQATTSEAFTEAGTSPWGVPCLPAGGISKNPACSDGFQCYGLTPTDADAFCTLFKCGQDSDCPGGWWCATVDSSPNVTTAAHNFGKTQTVCKPRDYCAPCAQDHDCPATADGTQQHCVALPGSGADGGAPSNYCAPQCASNANCAFDAKCVTTWSVCTPAQGATCKSDEDCPPANGTFQHCNAGSCTPECGSSADCTGTGQKCGTLDTCQPRAGACVGDGQFCSPCQSDADCKAGGGVCAYADYSTERFCTSAIANSGKCPAATTSGDDINTPTAGECPAPPAGSGAAVKGRGGVGCTILSDSIAPGNQCIPFTSISNGDGTYSSIPGCWTVDR